MEGLVTLRLVIKPKSKTTRTDVSKVTHTHTYQVLDEEGNVLCERKSTRVYVACAVVRFIPKGETKPCYGAPFFFGRLDLIGKGDSKNFAKWDSAYGIAYITKPSNESTD